MLTHMHVGSGCSHRRVRLIPLRSIALVLALAASLAALIVVVDPAYAEPIVNSTVFQAGESAQTAAEGITEGWTQVVKGGFTDPNNSYAPSWAKFKDYLYISTSANESGSVFSGSSKSGGDIWRTSDGVTWEQIGTAGLGNPKNYLFQLVVFNERLYAISNNFDHGIEIWASSDGTQFSKIEGGGFGDKENNWAFPWVYQGRLILGISNGETGGEIWVSDDGEAFRRVVDGGMGDSGVTGFTGFADPEHPDPVFQGQLYVGVSNPDSGGEIWRTADGLAWERVADGGLTRRNTIVLSPDIVYEGQLYAFGAAGGTIDNILGLDLFRSSDGTTWEQVVEDGFGVGEERNVSGDLVEFKDKLYLGSNTADPRLLNPSSPSERLAPRGFQLRVSDDGKSWTQIGEDGFGLETSIMGGMIVHGDIAYLSSFDYHAGSRLWRSTDGGNWEIIFQEPDPNFFQEGGGPLEFKGHFLWLSNDLKNGIEIWRSDKVMVAEPDTSTTVEGVDSTTSEGVATSVGSGGSTGGMEDTGETGEAGGLSGGWIALIAVLAVVALAAVIVVAFLFGRMGRTQSVGDPTGGGRADADPGLSQASTQESQAPSSFCAECGSALSPNGGFCPGCGRRL